MKTLTITFLLVFMVIQLSQAQKKYSLENLEKASQEELDIYLNKALKLQKTGRTFNIIGLSCIGAAVGSVILANTTSFDDWAAIGICIITVPVGGASLAVGIPMNLTGKNRAEIINSLNDTAFNGLKLELMPCTQYNHMERKYQPGITLRLSF